MKQDSQSSGCLDGARWPNGARALVCATIWLSCGALGALAACSAGSGDDLIEQKRCIPADPDPEKGCVLGYQCVCANPQKCFCIKLGQQAASTSVSPAAQPGDGNLGELEDSAAEAGPPEGGGYPGDGDSPEGDGTISPDATTPANP